MATILMHSWNFAHHCASFSVMGFMPPLCFSGILYAVGGYDGATRQCLSTVEAYNPKSNTWNYIAEMGTRRSGAGGNACVHCCWQTCKNILSNNATFYKTFHRGKRFISYCKPRLQCLLRCGCVKRFTLCCGGTRWSVGEEELWSLWSGLQQLETSSRHEHVSTQRR